MKFKEDYSPKDLKSILDQIIKALDIDLEDLESQEEELDENGSKRWNPGGKNFVVISDEKIWERL